MSLELESSVSQCVVNQGPYQSSNECTQYTDSQPRKARDQIDAPKALPSLTHTPSMNIFVYIGYFIHILILILILTNWSF